MNQRLGKQLLGVLALTVAVFFAFLQRPGLGDDFTYWKIGFETSQSIQGGWRMDNFHDLRWPIWGLCWLLDKLGGTGLPSYYGVPLLYLSAGALIAFLLARLALESERLAWLTVILFLFHPLLDPVAYRPMPDLAEGVWGAGTVLAWFAAMKASTRGRATAFAMLSGLLLAIAHSNRFTGLLLLPMLLVMTAVLFPQRWPRLLIVFAAAAAAISVECFIYWQITGDFLHSIHTNLGARGKKGTEAINPLFLPFRFLDTLWKGSTLSPFYLLLSLLGGWVIWRRVSSLGRAVVAWALIGYLGYSCALQQLWPPRPMLRDADRFLCALAIPMAVLIAAGAAWLWSQLRVQPQLRCQPVIAWCERHARLATVLGVGLICVVTSRQWFNLDYLPAFRQYLATRPPGTKVFTHLSMWDFSHLVNIDAARRIDFQVTTGGTPKANFLDSAPDQEDRAAASDEMWFSRKLMWLRSRKDQLYGDKKAQSPLANYVNSPEQQWTFAELIAEGEKPEFIFYHKRKPGTAPLVLGAADLGFVLPIIWDGKTRRTTLTIPVPEALRGKRVRVRTEAESNTVQALGVSLDFQHAGKWLASFEVKPQFFPNTATDFFNFEVPAEADHCYLEFRVEKSVQELKFSALQIVAD